MRALIVAIALGMGVCCFQAQAEEPVAPLQAKLQKAVEAAQKKDEMALSGICKELTLPDPDVWFASEFGDEDGAKIASAYTDMNVATSMSGLFQNIAQKGQTEIKITVVKTKDDPEANGNQREALAKMKNPVVLYSARFVVPGEPSGMHVYSFAEINGAFRFIGKMKLP